MSDMMEEYLDEEDSRMFSTKRRRNALSHMEKLKMIEEAKKRRCLWDTNNSDHSNTFAVLEAWREIANILDKSVDECKATWLSLRDSRRYHMNLAKKKSRGGGALQKPPLDNVGHWEFAKALSFLPNLKSRRIFPSKVGPKVKETESAFEMNEENGRWKRQKRTALFNDDEKRELCGMVKELPELWDIENHNHGNKSVIDQAWRNISSILDKPENDCRTAWTALRESYRYQLRVANKAQNSRAAGGVQTPNEPVFADSDDDDCEFSVFSALSFLPNISSRAGRRYSPTPKSKDDAISSNDERSLSTKRSFCRTPTIIKEESLSINEPEILYDCNTLLGMPPSPNPSPSVCAAVEDNTNKQPPLQMDNERRHELWQKFDQLLEQQSTQSTMNTSPFRAPLINIEWLLAKLPRDVAEDCCCDFQTLLLTKVREFNTTKQHN